MRDFRGSGVNACALIVRDRLFPKTRYSNIGVPIARLDSVLLDV